MKSLYLRIWLTVVAALALFALTSGWVMEHHLASERDQVQKQLAERMRPWAELIHNSLPAETAGIPAQTDALAEWSQRLHMPLALDGADGRRIAASDSFRRLESEGTDRLNKAIAVDLDDGRVLWMMRPQFIRGDGNKLQGAASGARSDPGPPGGPGADFGPGGPGGAGSPRGPGGDGAPGRFDGGPLGAMVPDMGPPDRNFGGGPTFGLPPLFPKEWPKAAVFGGLLGLLFIAVAAGAWPVVRGITRRLEELRRGVNAFGDGALGQRVEVVGHDEVAALAASFNSAAERIEALVTANQSLLANASHELRSPLARLKMAVAMLDGAPPAMQASLSREINTNIAELDALVEEVLLSSRLEAGAPMAQDDTVDLLGLGAEEAARVQAQATGESLKVRGSDRLLRRAIRNLLENARRYGGDEVLLSVAREGEHVAVRVSDRGPGVAEDLRERIFEPFYRLPGHAEREGGVGLGLALVRQIARAHQGSVVCEPRDGGGSSFVIRLPASALVP